MAYLGNNPDAYQYTVEVSRFNGTGACTQFTIPQDVDDAKAIEVIVNNVQQDPDNAYTVTNGLITFDEAPSVGTNNVIVLRRTGTTFTRTQIATSDILPNAVTTITIADGAITGAKIAALSVTGDKIGLTAINANNIVDGVITGTKIATGTITGDDLAANIIRANNIVAGQITGNLFAAGVVANATTETTFTANQTFTVANVTNQLASFGAAFQNIIRLTDGATITANLAQSCSFVVTLGGNRTLANGTNILAGQSGVIFVQQDGTGSRTLSFGTGWRFPSNTAPTLTTTAHAVDMIVFTAWNTSNIAAQAVLNVT